MGANTCKRRNRRWTNERVIKEICKRYNRGESLKTTVIMVEDRPLYSAACDRMGGWRQAIIAAGLPVDDILQPHRCRREQDVINAIQARHRNGLPLTLEAVNQVDSGLVRSAFKIPTLRAWTTALEKAGVPLNSKRLPGSKWTRARVIQLIQTSSTPEHVVRTREVPSSVVRAARKFFGSWQEALKAAGCSDAVSKVTEAILITRIIEENNKKRT